MNDLVIDNNERRSPNTIIGDDSRLMSLMEVAIKSDDGIKKLEGLMRLQERWEKNTARKSFFNAMAKFQKQLPLIEKKGLASFAHNNGQGKTEYTYAKLEDIAQAIKAPLSDNGLSYRFEQKTESSSSGLFISVTCIITHLEGHNEYADMSGYQDSSGKKNPIQEVASTVSYLRRYTLTGALGITVSDEDNDSNRGSSNKNENKNSEDGFLSQEKFNEMFPAWIKRIEGGKDPERLIGFLSHKNLKLSDTQKELIMRIGK